MRRSRSCEGGSRSAKAEAEAEALLCFSRRASQIGTRESQLAIRHSQSIRSRPVPSEQSTSHQHPRGSAYKRKPFDPTRLDSSGTQCISVQSGVRSAQRSQSKRSQSNTWRTGRKALLSESLARPGRSLDVRNARLLFPASLRLLPAALRNPETVQLLLSSTPTRSPLLTSPHLTSPPQLPRFLSVRSRRLSAQITQLSSAAACACATRT